MDLSLKNKEWKEFKIADIFIVENSKAYHKKNLYPTKNIGISYISRTKFNNGLEDIVETNTNLQINPENTIVFGAENAMFFYQPNRYITGNKMYVIKSNMINKYSGLFIKMMLDKSIKNSGFGYGKGLTGTRLKNRYVKLPINKYGEPDYEFMETYMRNKEQERINAYINYITARIKKLEKTKPVIPLKEKKWKEFFINEIFEQIQRGKRLKKSDHIPGKIPYVSSTAFNNGIDDFIGNKNNVRIFSNCISIANSGSVGASFYHPYKFIASDHVTKLENKSFNKHIYLFLSTITKRLGEKYSFNREISDKRIKREKILLPINDENLPDYEYMENYMKNLELERLKKYLKYKMDN